MSDDDLDALLALLKESVLFSGDIPKRRQLSHAEAAKADQTALRRLGDPELTAIQRVKNVWELVGTVDHLGKAKYAPAVPTFAELWQDSALVPVRNAAGNALLAIGTPEARDVLLHLIEDSDPFSVHLAVAAVFDADYAKAFDHFSRYFDTGCITQPGGAVVPNTILGTFTPRSFSVGPNGELRPEWTDLRAPSWLQQDTRWIRLCVALRKDKLLGGTARTVLRYSDPELAGIALEEAQLREGPCIVRMETRAAGDLLVRYNRGDYVGVWNEIKSHEALGGELLEEARAVANETMMRVARGIDHLSHRLANFGWKPLYGALRTRPGAEHQDVLSQIEVISVAFLPVSLRAFWEIVGGVNFVWDYEIGEAPNLGLDISMDQMDPLCVDPPETASGVFEDWEYQRLGVNPEFSDPFYLPLAPDDLHKANISGGGPYGIELPFLGADPIFMGEAHNLSFVDYLRLCFRYSGFPGLEHHTERTDVREFLKVMTKDLEPF